MLTEALSVFLDVILPVLLVVALGFLTRRFFEMDLKTLVILNLYLFAPAYLLSRLTQLKIDVWALSKIGSAVVIPVLVSVVMLTGLGVLGRVRKATLAGVVVGSVFYNSGNFGVAVAEIAFGPTGGQMQALVVMFTCLLTFILGYGILVLGHGTDYRALGRFLQLPYVYVIAVAILMQGLDWRFPASITQGLDVCAQGMVPVSLLTLGAQMGQRVRWPDWRKIGPVLLYKLILLPLLAWWVVAWLGLWPWPGRLLVLAAAAPTAVNTLVMSLDLDGDADLAADCVFWSTLASSLTVAVWLTIVTRTP